MYSGSNYFRVMWIKIWRTHRTGPGAVKSWSLSPVSFTSSSYFLPTTLHGRQCYSWIIQGEMSDLLMLSNLPGLSNAAGSLGSYHKRTLPSEWPWLVRNQRETSFLYLPRFGLDAIWIGFKIWWILYSLKVIRSKGEGLAGSPATVWKMH